jgi:oxygen-independent coproporphyrinogen-3 oxidase
MMESAPTIDLELVRKYNQPGPRYTSYPPATEFSGEIDGETLMRATGEGDGPLSVYVHLPFCEMLCWFCGCHTVITRNRDQADTYLDAVEREIARTRSLMRDGREAVQLHLGGGTPNFLRVEQIERLGRILRTHFTIAERAECSVELDPRRLSEEQVGAFADMGMHRASFGVQDIDPQVQKAIHRVQDMQTNHAAMAHLRRHGFESVNIDLIYGLPGQTPEGFRRTIEAVLTLEPDRLAVFNYAHVPWLKPAQKIVARHALPDAEMKLALLRTVFETLGEAGYIAVGMDHFARVEDELVRAQAEGTLQRNFQGYSTRAGAEIAAFGVSAISQTERTYRQNAKDLETYFARINAGEWPVERGCLLGDEDRLRREVIMRLMCDLRLDFRAFERRWNIAFAEHFSEALERLEAMRADGLVRVDDEALTVLGPGRLLIRNIAMAFDAYYAPKENRFSRTI